MTAASQHCVPACRNRGRAHASLQAAFTQSVGQLLLLISATLLSLTTSHHEGNRAHPGRPVREPDWCKGRKKCWEQVNLLLLLFVSVFDSYVKLFFFKRHFFYYVFWHFQSFLKMYSTDIIRQLSSVFYCIKHFCMCIKM